MADKMDVDAVNGEREAETVGPAQTDLPPERSMFSPYSKNISTNERR